MCAALVALSFVVLTTSATAASPTTSAPSTDLEQQLLDRYAPEMVFQQQPKPCGPGEPYRPIDPALIFGRSGVVLRGPGGAVVERPTVEDLPRSPDGSDWYIDLPGDALEPKCTYEQFQDSLDPSPVVQGRLATDPDHPDRLVLQYWFYYVFNDWNDRHESDWEMIQVEFQASTIQEALDAQPVRTAYAQHEGAELSSWTDGAVSVVDDSHPLVFPGAGSHASYYSSARWFGSSAQSGFGCDDTLGPSDRERPPVARIDTEQPPAWLDYLGHWGEKQPSFNNGPTGPITKEQWSHPVTWMDEEGRTGAVSLPAGGTVVTDFFCDAARLGSILLFRLLNSPGLVILLFAVGIAALVVLVRSTRWRPVRLDPVLQRRAGGQMIGSSLRLVRRHRRVFLPLGLVMVIAGLLAGLLQLLLVQATEVGEVVEVVDDRSAWASIVVLTVTFAVVLPVTAIVGVATHLGVRALDDGTSVRARDLLRGAVSRPRALVTQIASTLLLVVGFASVVLAPVTLWLWARWAVIVPASIDTAHPLASSSRLTRGWRLRSLMLTGATTAFVGLVPPLIGTLVLLATGWGFALVNLVAALVAVVVVPIGAIVIALEYGDLTRRTSDRSGEFG